MTTKTKIRCSSRIALPMKGIFAMILITIMTVTMAEAGDAIRVADTGRGPLPENRTSFPQPAVTEQYEYYDIKGSCVKDLKDEIGRNSVVWNDGKRYDSFTTWYVTWKYDYVRTGGTCVPDNFRTAVEIVFHLPRWERGKNAPLPLVVKWEKYLKNLAVHESGHRDMAVEAAVELSPAVAQLPPAVTCAELDRQVKGLCRERIEKLNVDERQYDAATRHGLTQGAVFP